MHILYFPIASDRVFFREQYEALHFTVEDFEEVAGPVALSDDKVALLMGRMRFPSLSLHGIEGAWSGPGPMTIIPSTVKGKFSIRSAPLNEFFEKLALH